MERAARKGLAHHKWAGGYARTSLSLVEHFKRIPATDRFSVIRANDVDPASCFDIGRLLNRKVGRHIAPRSGELWRYAYDLPGMY